MKYPQQEKIMGIAGRLSGLAFAFYVQLHSYGPTQRMINSPTCCLQHQPKVECVQSNRPKLFEPSIIQSHEEHELDLPCKNGAPPWLSVLNILGFVHKVYGKVFWFRALAVFLYKKYRKIQADRPLKAEVLDLWFISLSYQAISGRAWFQIKLFAEKFNMEIDFHINNSQR